MLQESGTSIGGSERRQSVDLHVVITLLVRARIPARLTLPLGCFIIATLYRKLDESGKDCITNVTSDNRMWYTETCMHSAAHFSTGSPTITNKRSGSLSEIGRSLPQAALPLLGSLTELPSGLCLTNAIKRFRALHSCSLKQGMQA